MSDRKKRVQRLKIMIIILVAVFLILPSVFCVALTMRVGQLDKQIRMLQEELKAQVSAKQENSSVISTDVIISQPVENVEEEPLEENLRKVYLTFDDGPSQYTEEILEILDFYDVKATFFVTGMNASRYEAYYKKIVDAGHTLGIHTYSHVYSDIYGSLDGFITDWKKMQDYLYQCTGQRVNIYRFPGGSSNTIVGTATMNEIMDWLNREGIVYYDWNVSGQDAASVRLSADQIVANCVEGVKNRNTAIVLLHDGAGKKSTIEALPLIIEGIQKLENTILLPIDENTVPIQHISITKE